MPEVVFRADVRLLPRSAGGRKAPARSGYRPGVWFGATGRQGEPEVHSCVAQVIGADVLEAGSPGVLELVPLALETWPAVRVGSGFDLVEGARTVGHGILTSVPTQGLFSGELRRALQGALEDWVRERFGDRVARRPPRSTGLDPDLIAWFDDGAGQRRTLVAEVVARRPWRRDVERLARIMEREGSTLGLIVGLDEPSMSVREAVYQYGSVGLGDGQSVPRIRVLTTQDLLARDVALLPGAREPRALELRSAV